jgi:hypothetical protein
LGGDFVQAVVGAAFFGAFDPLAFVVVFAVVLLYSDLHKHTHTFR